MKTIFYITFISSKGLLKIYAHFVKNTSSFQKKNKKQNKKNKKKKQMIDFIEVVIVYFNLSKLLES